MEQRSNYSHFSATQLFPGEIKPGSFFFHQSPTYSLPYTQKAAVWTKVPLTKLSVSFFPYLAKQVDSQLALGYPIHTMAMLDIQ